VNFLNMVMVMIFFVLLYVAMYLTLPTFLDNVQEARNKASEIMEDYIGNF